MGNSSSSTIIYDSSDEENPVAEEEILVSDHEEGEIRPVDEGELPQPQPQPPLGLDSAIEDLFLQRLMAHVAAQESNVNSGNESGDSSGGLEIHKSSVVKIPVAVKKTSIHLKQEKKKEKGIDLSKDDESTSSLRSISFLSPFSLEFEMDCKVECLVRILWGPVSRSGAYQSCLNNTEATRTLSEGMNQNIIFSSDELPNISEKDLKTILDSSKCDYPLAIIIQNLFYKNGHQEMKEMQLFMKLEKQDDELYNLVLDKINIFLDQDEYVLYELFGLNSVNEEGEPEECVICMTEERTTVLLPCRHVCLCEECSELFRTRTEKCPICRSRVLNLLQKEASPNVIEV
mmetsp:Transcript_11801/g.20190  ORF Transcript_11801/g.20190 Transcript_11801/m.20190 type:complete len:345 (+) Transcript_11801:24-1058(+)